MQAKVEQRARVLLIGERNELRELHDALSGASYEVSQADGPSALEAAARVEPDAIVVLARNEPSLAMTVRNLRADSRTRRVPVLLQGPENVLRSPAFRSLPVDEQLPVDRGPGELDRRLAALVRAKRLVDTEERTRGRLEALLEISQAAASSLELAQILRLVVRKLADVVHSDRCAILLTETNGDVVVAATVEAPELGHHLRLDLSLYPELALALQHREAVIIEDARTDPRMAAVREILEPLDVRSILVQPIVSGNEVQGAIFMRQMGRDRAFDEEDRAFAHGVSSALGDHLRNARLHADLRHKKDELEAAYVDRYKELASANRRLKDVNEFKDQLIALISHDIRAPLNVLLGHGQLLQELEDLEAQDRASIDAIVRQGRKILELVEGLLEKGRGEASRLELEPSELDLALQCMEAARELELLAKQKGVTLRVEAPGELWAVADRLKVRQVLQNLIQNGINHASKRVTVYAERVRRDGGDQARLSVVDDGPGIPPELLPVIFDRYRKGEGEGTGLGLAICREFVELHGGEIWAENSAEGGASFRLLLPLAVDDQLNRVKDKPRVLLVEDEPGVAQQGMEILRTRYRVEVARDGAEGVAKARALRPDLILLDVFLPRVDGLDAAAAIRRSPDLAQVPIILIAAKPGVADKVRALHLGLAGQVKKPFEPQALLQAVESALNAPQREPERQAGMDPETGFLDVHGLVKRAQLEEARARRYERPLSAVVLAAPRKPSPGQLAELARLLRGAARATDVVGHLGDGAFAVLLPECDEAVASALAERLSAVVQQAVPGSRAEAAQCSPDESRTSCEAVLKKLAAKLRARKR